MRSPRGENTRAGPAQLRLVAFDMDGVLIDHKSSWAAVHEALGTRSGQAVADFIDGRIDDREFILRDVDLWRRARPAFSRDELRAILAGIPRMPGLAKSILELRSSGVQCVIVSGGLRTLADRIAADHGFSAARSNDVVFGSDGRLADDAVVDVPLREKGSVLQAIQAQLGVDPAETASIGDSRFDVGLFAQSRVGIAFNPVDDHVAEGATHVVRSRDLFAAVKPLLEGLTDSR